MRLKNKTFNSVIYPQVPVFIMLSMAKHVELLFLFVQVTAFSFHVLSNFHLRNLLFFHFSGEGATIPLLRVSNKWVRSQRSCLTGCGDPVIDTHQQNDIWDQHNTNRERKRQAGTGGGCGNSSQASGHIPTGDFAKRRQWDGWNVTLQSEEQDLFLLHSEL